MPHAPRRVLVATTEPWDAASSQLVAAAAALIEGGDTVVLAALDPTLAEWSAHVAGSHTARVLPSNGFREVRAVLRELVAVHHFDTALVSGDVAHRAAAAALGPEGVILRRTPLFDDTISATVSLRLALRRVPTAFLVPDPSLERAGRPLVGANARLRALHTAIPLVVPQMEMPGELVQESHATERVLLVLPDHHNPLGSLPALRTAARVLHRHPRHRVHLLGTADVTQPLRVHAAALGVANHVSAGSFSSPWLTDVPRSAIAWIDAPGDRGAVATVGCLARGIPVLLSSSSPLCPLVPHGVAGLHMVPDATLGNAAAQLARLVGTPAELEVLQTGAWQIARQAHDPARLSELVATVAARLNRERTRAA